MLDAEYSRSMTCFMMLLLSPSQIGPASTRMFAAMIWSRMPGQASVSQPCSVMSG